MAWLCEVEVLYYDLLHHYYTNLCGRLSISLIKTMSKMFIVFFLQKIEKKLKMIIYFTRSDLVWILLKR